MHLPAAGWFKAYSGFAMASISTSVGGGERICVDNENFDATSSFGSGARFFPTEYENPGNYGLSANLDVREMTCSVFMKNP